MTRANELDTKAPYEATFVLVHPYSTRMRTTMTAMMRAAMAMFLVLMMRISFGGSLNRTMRTRSTRRRTDMAPDSQ